MLPRAREPRCCWRLIPKQSSAHRALLPARVCRGCAGDLCGSLVCWPRAPGSRDYPPGEGRPGRKTWWPSRLSTSKSSYPHPKSSPPLPGHTQTCGWSSTLQTHTKSECHAKPSREDGMDTLEGSFAEALMVSEEGASVSTSCWRALSPGACARVRVSVSERCCLSPEPQPALPLSTDLAQDCSPEDCSPGDCSPGDCLPGDSSPGDSSPGDCSPGATSPAGLHGGFSFWRTSE